MGKAGSDVYVPAYLNITDTYVGIFGNADPLDYTQWLKIALETTNTVPSYKVASRTCDDMITSLHYKFLVAYVGSETNPQAKIIGAQVEYKREDVTFFAEDTQQQNFMFFTTVSFITYGDSNYNTYAPASALFASITTAMVATLLLFAPAMAPSEW